MSDKEYNAVPYSKFVDGFRIPGPFSEERFRSALEYNPRPGDIFIVTYPKCGTTWVQHILLLLFNEGKPPESMHEVRLRSPFLDIQGAESVKKMSKPGAIKTHLPFHLVPWSTEAKYIYVARNPKDCCVSYFHHTRNIPGHYFNGSFDEYFEFFITGEVDFGDYFDHLLGWYAHRNDSNVLFVTYEEMKEDIEAIILKLASFLDGEKYTKLIKNDHQLMENIIKYSSFDYLKETVNKGMAEHFAKFHSHHTENNEASQVQKQVPADLKRQHKTDPSKFVRKGIVGDWRNYFSPEQSSRLDEKMTEKTKGTDIASLWNKFM